MPLMQVLHATVMKQLEIAELLENLRASKSQVNCFSVIFLVFKYFISYALLPIFTQPISSLNYAVNN